jgi:AcrR family transcriptional regulator
VTATPRRDPDGPTLRERRAQLTHDEILEAARRLFGERGYAGTSMRDIATAAGVSAQTVYDSVGSKQALVARLNDLIDAEAGIEDLARRAATSTDPGEVVTTQARVTRSILENCGDIVRALVSGAASEPDLRPPLEEGQRRHMLGAQQTIERLRTLGALDERLSPADAADTLAAISDVRCALVLLDGYGWDLDRIEDWIAATSRALLLRPGRTA